MDMPPIIIHSFTYAGDEYLTEEHAHCIRQALPEARIVVIDDGHNPSSEEVRDKLTALGAEWRVSYWKRNRNLNGPEAIMGIVDEMLASASSGNDVLVKIDPDTVLLDGQALREFACSGKMLWGSSSSAALLHGCAYAAPASALRKAKSILTIKTLQPNDPEDCSIGGALMFLYPEPGMLELTHPCSPDHPESLWAGYHWGCFPNVAPYVRFSVVVTGNQPPPHLSKRNRLDVMQSLRELKKTLLPLKNNE